MKTRTVVGAASALAILVLVVFRVLSVGSSASAATTDAARPPLVPVARVARAAVAQTVVITGSVRARNAVEVHPELPGRVVAVHARVGDSVKAGQLLATLEHEELSWQVKAAQAAVAVARAGLEGARLEHERTRELHDGGAAPSAQLDGSRVRLALAQAQVEQAEAAAGLAALQLDKARIVSPIGGVVTRRSVDVGVQVGPQTTLCVVEDLAELKLESAVDAAEWSRIADGAPADITSDARPGEVFHGRVTLRSPSLDPATRRASIELTVDGAPRALLPGMFARATIAAEAVQAALVVPREAVVEAAGGALVWRLKSGSAEALRPRLGQSDERNVVVLEGLAEGDVVATAGQASLANGAPARAATAAN